MRADNLLQFIHQVTIEFRYRKSLAQERFKSNLEFRYQVIVSSIKFRKGLRSMAANRDPRGLSIHRAIILMISRLFPVLKLVQVQKFAPGTLSTN